jgi:hypothetical protein
MKGPPVSMHPSSQREALSLSELQGAAAAAAFFAMFVQAGPQVPPAMSSRVSS